jgi:uncharacterized protein involved in exopolysaccharide biosynthesis
MLAKARSRQRRRVIIGVVAVAIPVLVCLLLTSVRNYSAVSGLVIPRGVSGIVLLSIFRSLRLELRARKSVEESLSKLSPPRP